MPRWKKFVRPLLLAVLLWVALVLAGCGAYRRLLFPAPSHPPLIPPGYGELISTRTTDGVSAQGLYFPPPTTGAPFIVFFHGNGETVSYNLWRSEDFRSLGYGVLLAEYRGYGTARSSGSPTEVGLYADAEALILAVEARGIDKANIVLWGFSLGTGVASEMAYRGHGCAMILEAPYTSIIDMADRIAPFLPTHSIVKDKFDTYAKAPSIRIPALVIHGDRDRTVPFFMGEKISRALPNAQFHGVSGAGHMDLEDVDQVGIYTAATTLINSACHAPAPK